MKHQTGRSEAALRGGSLATARALVRSPAGTLPRFPCPNAACRSDRCAPARAKPLAASRQPVRHITAAHSTARLGRAYPMRLADPLPSHNTHGVCVLWVPGLPASRKTKRAARGPRDHRSRLYVIEAGGCLTEPMRLAGPRPPHQPPMRSGRTRGPRLGTPARNTTPAILSINVILVRPVRNSRIGL